MAYKTAYLLKPTAQAEPKDRRVWSIPLSNVWVPYFTAMKVAGEVNIADETLGAPLRLATEKDGTPRFNTKGLPMLRVVKELADQVRVIRDNFVQTLIGDTAAIQQSHKAAYKAQVEAARTAGEPVLQADVQKVLVYLQAVEAARKAAETPSDTGQAMPEPVAA